MSEVEQGGCESLSRLEQVLAELSAPASGDFALRVLDRVGISRDRYDTYVRFELPVGGLYVASSLHAVTGAALAAEAGTPQVFEELHRSRTGRSVVPATTPPSGVRTFLRTGRNKKLRIDLDRLPEPQQSVLSVVREVPHGQLRPVSWVVREAEVTDHDTVVEALAVNPVPVLIPSHRITYDDAVPCDVGYPVGAGPALRTAEGIDMQRMHTLSRQGLLLLGSDTTRIYCHPTCAHARRITPVHQMPFHSARDAEAAGYRACRSCRPVAA